jgi:predicted nucleic acid-binding protein
MIFFDTNVLVYSTINQELGKQEISDRLIEEAIREERFSISPLVISELIFVLTKLGIDKNLVGNAILLYKPFVKNPIDASLVFEGYKLCSELNFCKNINDAIHLKFAEKYCSKIFTFDSDFKKFRNSTSLEIDILHS